MITTHVNTESKPVEQLNDAADGQNCIESCRPHISTFVRMCAHLRNNAVLTAISTQVMALHEWISDPPMTERDRNKLYIIETGKPAKDGAMAGR